MRFLNLGFNERFNLQIESKNMGQGELLSTG